MLNQLIGQAIIAQLYISMDEGLKGLTEGYKKYVL